MECLKCLYLSSVDTVADDLASKVAHMIHKRACVHVYVIHLNVHIQLKMVSCAVRYSCGRLVLMG